MVPYFRIKKNYRHQCSKSVMNQTIYDPEGIGVHSTNNLTLPSPPFVSISNVVRNRIIDGTALLY